MNKATRFTVIACLIGLTGCPAAPLPRPTPPQPPVDQAPEPPPVDPFAVTGTLDKESLPSLPLEIPAVSIAYRAAPPGVPQPPPKCRAFVSRRAEASSPCPDNAAGQAALVAALKHKEPAVRDGMLMSAEACSALPVGLVRALRAELAPTECADAIVGPLLTKPLAGLSPALHHTLFGLALAGRLARTATTAPKLAPPYERKLVEDFVKGPLRTWIFQQASAVQQLAKLGSRLVYYGRAVVAVEAGMADMRFIDVIRKAPIPDEFAADQGLSDAYYTRLERDLEPRKRRGRDATLVGLGQLAFVGVIRDPRVTRTRKLLGRMYGGRPIDALDRLLLPPLETVEPKSTEQQLAARLPTFYASLIFAPEKATQPDMLRFLMERGVALPHRIALQQASLNQPMRALYARARFELGQNYWRKVDFDQVLELLRDFPAAERPDRVRMLLALGLALRGGPQNAAQMMLKAPLSELGIGQVGALDALSAAQPAGPYAAFAAFDAALVSRLATPRNADAATWRKLGERFRRAAGQLADATHRAEAQRWAEEAEQTAKSIETHNP